MPAIIASRSCPVRADEAFCIRHQCELFGYVREIDPFRRTSVKFFGL